MCIRDSNAIDAGRSDPTPPPGVSAESTARNTPEMAALFTDERREAGQPATRRDPADARAGADQGRDAPRLSFCVLTTGECRQSEATAQGRSPAGQGRSSRTSLLLRDATNDRMPKADPHRCRQGGGGTAGWGQQREPADDNTPLAVIELVDRDPEAKGAEDKARHCLLYTSPSPRD